MVLKENWSSGDQLTAAQLNELTAAVKARYTKPGAGIPTSDLNAGQLEAKVKEVGDANYATPSQLPKYPVGSTIASRTPRPFHVDLRDYVVSTTPRTGRDPIYVFDVSAVVAAMEARTGVCFVPPGDWRPDAINTPLDSALGDSYNSPKQRFTYAFQGTGKISRILFPTGMAATDLVFVANSTQTNDFHTHPKVIVRDLALAGCDLPTVDTPTPGGFLRGYQRSFCVERVEVTGCKDPFRSGGYADLHRFSHVYAHDMASGSFILNAESSTGGDGWEFDHLIPYGTGGVKVNLTRGATLSRCCSGWYEFINSDVTLIDNHIEGDGAGYNNIPSVTVKGSRVHVRSGYHQSRPGKPSFSIDDSSTIYGSVLTVDAQVQSVSRLDSPGSDEGPLADPFIDISAATIQTTIHLHHVRTALFAQRGDTGAADSVRAVVGPLVTASGAPGIAAVITSLVQRILLSQDCTLRWTNGTWEVQPYEQREAVIGVPALVADTRLSSAVTAVTNAAYDAAAGLSAGTYYYRFWTTNLAGFNSQQSQERTVTTTSGQIPQIVLDTYTAPVALTIVRGTSSGTYTHWARIWVSRESLTLVDQGSHIGGVAWSTVSAPTPPSANEMIECEVLRRPFGAVRRRVYGTAAPTLGNWSVGDQCINTAPAAGGAPGWVCVTAGYPGTWKAMSALAS